MTDLNGGAFFDAEFVIRDGAAPYRKGQVCTQFLPPPQLSTVTARITSDVRKAVMPPNSRVILMYGI
ncbi:hypothetical protein J3A98_002141 [Pseudomonas sp. BP6]|nr:hypothetical protein [Pseudomonas sp. BP6]MBP2289581.1 hypothetical protein [Pseudomonas sp. BP7]